MIKSKIEDDIAELNSIINNSKRSMLSQGKILVDREELEELVERMRKDLPKELEYCRELMSRSEAIENDAKARAEKLIQDATDKTYELLSENEINQQAKKKADDIVRNAAIKGQQIYDEYVAEGEAYRQSAQNYLNDMLLNLQEMIYSCIDVTTRNTNKFLDSLGKVGDTVTDNLNELNSSGEDEGEDEGSDVNQTGSMDIDINI